MKKWILLLLLLVAVPAWGQSARYDSIAIGPRGVTVPGAQVAVCKQPATTTTQPCSPLATLATSITTTSGGANPLTADNLGNYHFYAPAGFYTIQVYGSNIQGQFVMTDVSVGLGTAYVQYVTAATAGADWCAKVLTADAAIGNAYGEIWIDQTANTGACAGGLTMGFGGRHIRFIPGTTSGNWVINGPFAILQQTFVDGVCWRCTTLVVNSNTDGIAAITSGAGKSQAIEIKYMSILDGFGGGRTAGAGINIFGTTNSATFNLERNYVQGFQDGFKLGNFLESRLEHNSSFSNLRHGFNINCTGCSGGQANTTLYSDTNTAQSNAVWGFFVDTQGISEWYSSNDIAQLNGTGGAGGGFFCNNCLRYAANGPDFEQNQGIGQKFLGTGSGTGGNIDIQQGNWLGQNVAGATDLLVLDSVAFAKVSGTLAPGVGGASGACIRTLQTNANSMQISFKNGSVGACTGGAAVFAANTQWTAENFSGLTLPGSNTFLQTFGNSNALGTAAGFLLGDTNAGGHSYRVVTGIQVDTGLHIDDCGLTSANPFCSGAAGPNTILNIQPNSAGGGILLKGTIQNQAGTATMGLTLKKGSGSGNYTNATTSYTVADSSNLCLTVTIPTGWKLHISASGILGTATAAVVANVALTDNAACSTANAGVLVESTVTGTAAAVLEPFALNWVITGDGAAHNVALQFKTSNAADAATLGNSTATLLPTMVFTLMPSN
jgi:hypothetical protein